MIKIGSIVRDTHLDKIAIVVSVQKSGYAVILPDGTRHYVSKLFLEVICDR